MLNPNVTEPPGGIVPFHPTLLTVTVEPLALKVPFQLLVTLVSPAKPKFTSQPLTAVEPLFFTVTFTVAPPPHVFSETDTERFPPSVAVQAAAVVRLLWLPRLLWLSRLLW